MQGNGRPVEADVAKAVSERASELFGRQWQALTVSRTASPAMTELCLRIYTVGYAAGRADAKCMDLEQLMAMYGKEA